MVRKPPDAILCHALHDKEYPFHKYEKKKKKKKEKKESEPRYHKSQQSKRNTSSPSKIAASVPLFGTCLFFIPAIPPKVNSSRYLSITHLPSAGSLGMGD